ncbi:NADH-dependent flavin oxidoreductase [Agrilactobacillus yilanensis]|uniref:NADH-dependent flavin oxidoreductase n=1 Tax=Agrilactobacillus yilanensis TaxID=2485997 RepID=A0ABW4J6A1_9LACO|nr:NADH-dependent flavin oxidoreductase [Agrilactobacillus yilanensis]
MTYNFLKNYTFTNGMTVKNRIVMAPMTTMSSYYNGMITDEEAAYYGLRAGGPGMIITGVANVNELGRGFEGELSIANDDMLPGLEKLAKSIKKEGTRAILQIFSAGRKSSSKILRGEQPVSASAIAATYPADSETPRALTEPEILQLIEDFGAATKRAIQAGFNGVELHGANTYLLQQFFSENANQRTDDWGGSREKRMKFALAVIDKVRDVIATYAKRPFLLGYRISPEEIETPGIRLADSLYFVDQIKNKVSYIHLSMGSYERTSLNDKTDNETLIAKFHAHTDGIVPLIGIGSIESPEDATAALDDGADFAAIGRELIREPKWVQKVMHDDLASIRTQISPFDMDELLIPTAMQQYLLTSFRSVINFTTDAAKAEDYQNELAPMEGFEKKL